MTYELVPAELTQVDNGDGTLRGINLGGVKRDKLDEQTK
jgi:hypothetical protein